MYLYEKDNEEYLNIYKLGPDDSIKDYKITFINESKFYTIDTCASSIETTLSNFNTITSYKLYDNYFNNLKEENEPSNSFPFSSELLIREGIKQKYINGDFSKISPININFKDVNIPLLLTTEGKNYKNDIFNAELIKLSNLLKLPENLLKLQLLETFNYDYIVNNNLDVSEQLNLFHLYGVDKISLAELKKLIGYSFISKDINDYLNKKIYNSEKILSMKKRY